MLQIAFSSCILIMNLSANSDQWQQLHPRDKVLDKQIQNLFAFCLYLNSRHSNEIHFQTMTLFYCDDC